MRCRIIPHINSYTILCVASLPTITLAAFAGTDELYDTLDQAAVVTRTGKVEQALTALLNQEADGAHIGYELGLTYQSQGKQDQATKFFRGGLSMISAPGAIYIGVKKCKSFALSFVLNEVYMGNPRL